MMRYACRFCLKRSTNREVYFFILLASQLLVRMHIVEGLDAVDVTAPAPMSVTNVNLSPTYGPIIIGTFLSLLLYGMTVVQTIVYFIIYHLVQKFWEYSSF